MKETATFAAGCFWGVEDIFRKTHGVLSTRVGYTGGLTKEPTYEAVCSDTTGHAEAVEVIFDSEVISYEKLLELFWRLHDPTQLNRQGPDMGSQYRSAIFYHTPHQEEAARASLQHLSQSGIYNRPIVTRIEPSDTFYPAEAYHQQYVEKHGRHCSL